MTSYDLEVGAVAAGGACVARTPDGRVVFVRHTLPGERVRAEVTAETAHFLRADAVEVLTAAPDRVPPPCPYARPGRCGGCDFQHVALPAQRQLKANLVAEQLRRVAKIDVPVDVEPALGESDGLGYRTRLSLAVDAEGRPGLHRHRSHQLEHIEECLIAAPEVAAVGAQRLRWPGARAVEVAGADGGQRVVAVTGPLREMPDVDAGAVVGGRPVRVPHGVQHEVLDRSFQVAAGVFWQVHRGAAETLTRAVLTGLEPQPGERVVDLYAGAGLFAAFLGAAVGPQGQVTAVEGDARAAADAARNTADLPQVRIRTAAVDARLVAKLGDVDLVVLDPPRAGAGLPVSRALAALRPRRLAYVSCDPATFARDLRVFLDAGWSLESLRAFDLFPMTEHVELVAVLTPPRAVVSAD
ncbi:MAG TPA: TRAM domain-containing protein [Mycobacteriales bacterium]|nr:TRAM domain-containing protein [Mycobacteriales bacterium]